MKMVKNKERHQGKQRGLKDGHRMHTGNKIDLPHRFLEAQSTSPLEGGEQITTKQCSISTLFNSTTST